VEKKEENNNKQNFFIKLVVTKQLNPYLGADLKLIED
jgi:hypothetical protein